MYIPHSVRNSQQPDGSENFIISQPENAVETFTTELLFFVCLFVETDLNTTNITGKNSRSPLQTFNNGNQVKPEIHTYTYSFIY